MDHGLMVGMFVGGVLLSALPIGLSIALCVAGYRAYRAEQEAERRGPGG
jgi:hypothetical protein